MVKDLAKIYRENFNHKHTLKYIREVVENNIDSKFKFEIKEISKTFAPVDSLDRIWKDYDFSDEERKLFDRVKGRFRPSYTIVIAREDDLYEDCTLDDYIYLLECLKKADSEFSKKNLKLIPNTIDNEMDFDVIEMNNEFTMTKDNANISEFLDSIRWSYRTYQGRNYEMVIDDNSFYRVSIMNGYNATTEAQNKENIEHLNRKKQKLFEEIGQFHNDNYEKYITELAKANPITGFDEASKSLDKYRDISTLYFKGCTLQELKDAFIDLKSDFGEYLPEIKKELRDEHIDSLLEEE